MVSISTTTQVVALAPAEDIAWVQPRNSGTSSAFSIETSPVSLSGLEMELQVPGKQGYGPE